MPPYIYTYTCIHQTRDIRIHLFFYQHWSRELILSTAVCLNLQSTKNTLNTWRSIMKLHFTRRFISRTEVHKTYDPTRNNKYFLLTPGLVSSAHTMETRMKQTDVPNSRSGKSILPPLPPRILSLSSCASKGFAYLSLYVTWTGRISHLLHNERHLM